MLRWKVKLLRVCWGAAKPLTGRTVFMVRELLERRMTRGYTLKRSGLRLVLRHPLVDVAVLAEMFAQDAYAMPARVGQQLRELQRPIRVLDLGGNIGLFGLRIFEQFPDAQITAFEPDPRNLNVLQRCVAANPGLNWRIVPAAAAVRDGEASFISDFALAQLSTVATDFGGHTDRDRWLPPDAIAKHPPTVDTVVRVKDVFPDMLKCDLLKIDIEGAEWELLQDPRFGEINALAVVLEVHPRPGETPEAVAERLTTAFAAAGLTWRGIWEAGSNVWATRAA